MFLNNTFFKKSFKMAKKIFILLVISLNCSACVIGFSNFQNHIPEEYAKVYVPAAIDNSIYSGNSSRLSQAIRKELSLRTDLQLTDINHAQWALFIKITDRLQNIIAVDDCKNPSAASIANGAYLCSKIHPELTNQANVPYSLNQPNISPAKEELSLIAEIKAIDLNTGNVIWAKEYSSKNIQPISFHEIGDTDGKTVKYMQWTPDLHVLRYQEAVDNAVMSFANTVASDVLKTIFASMPKRGSKSTN